MPHKIESRRYTGSKAKLLDWIFTLIDEYCRGEIFVDIFAGTGVVAATAATRFKHIILNDFLYSNYAIYYAFFAKSPWDRAKIEKMINQYNCIDTSKLKDNYFSKNFGDKYFPRITAKLIGEIREDIEKKKKVLTTKEYCVLLSSLIYSADKVANTVGHYDAYIREKPTLNKFLLEIINPINIDMVNIYREDANLLANRVKADVVYIDPPYNSRQYSRFYHVLETLTKWEKPKLYGVALKPHPENVSEYCKVAAPDKFSELIRSLTCSYIVVSYNNTYNSKSSSSKNKIQLEQIKNILEKKGSTKIFNKKHRYFNSGKTNFDDHQEYLFITKVNGSK